jgi:C1A family cysteine protease
MKRRSLGWRRDSLDKRDNIFSSSRLKEYIKVLPAHVDLRSSFPPCYDQGELGSCTAQAVGSICDYKYGLDNTFFPSRLFLYYMTRKLEGTTFIDNGATLRNTIKAINKFGVCDESVWNYIIANFNIEPPSWVKVLAEKHQAVSYRRVKQRLDDLRAAIADSHPVAFGFSVYENLYSLNKDKYLLEFPDPNDAPEGGHAVTAVGYDDTLQYFIIRNSWGEEWGSNGYFLMPYNFILDKTLCSDFWTIELME